MPRPAAPAHPGAPSPAVAAGLAGDAASRRAALASVYLEAADIHTIRGQVQAIEAAQEHAAAPENQADTVPAAAAAHREPAYEGGVPPNLRQVNPLADFLCLSWGDVTGVVGECRAASALPAARAVDSRHSGLDVHGSWERACRCRLCHFLLLQAS